MKVLLDEQIPHPLRLLLGVHEVLPADYMGWKGLKNGSLLQKAADHGFQAVITNDAGIEFEQDRAALPVAVLYLKAGSNRIEDMQPLVPRILRALSMLKPNALNRLPE